MPSPTVAICIPTYNQAVYLKKSVLSALSQSYSSVEVWVSDDCSTDETAEVAKDLLSQYSSLRYHRQKVNLGISANNNWLLSQPQTDFIVRLDSDDLLHPRYIEELVPLLEVHPQAGYAHCAIQEIDQHDQPRRVRVLGQRSIYQDADDALRASITGYRVAANICMFRQEVLEQMNFYKSKLLFAEDWDLAVRIADAGWGNVYCDQILASYRFWEDASNIRPKRKYDEIEGCREVFEQSLHPAFSRRNWPTSFIANSRKKVALSHAIVLDAPYFTSNEQASLVEALTRLGDSPQLRISIWMLQHRMGFILRSRNKISLTLRSLVKKIVWKIGKVRKS